MQKKTETL